MEKTVQIWTLRRLVVILIWLAAGYTSGFSQQQAFSKKQPNPVTPASSLKKALEGKFYIGTALATAQIAGRDMDALAVVKKHFNAIVPENCMKSEIIQPREGEFDFTLADRFVDFGEKHHMLINGHTLIWHSQTPSWFFTDQSGKPVSRQVLIQRMKDHIFAVVGRYKGRVHSWDVVNEALLDNGLYRKTPFYEIIGEDYIRLAFEFAHQADPKAELYYNDYSLANPAKRAGLVKLVTKLQRQGVKIHGIGMQGHIGLSYPSLAEFEKSILAFDRLGVNVMISELDLTVLPAPPKTTAAEISIDVNYSAALDPYANGLPDSTQKAFTERYLNLFRLLLAHHDKISRVTLWGVSDRYSWRNNWPVRGRTDYPLLFDRNNRPKAVVDSLLLPDFARE